MDSKVVTVTTKGQATIPSKMRKKYRIRKKVVFTEAKEGILIRPIPDPFLEVGSLKSLFKGRAAADIISEARAAEVKAEAKRK